MIKEICQFVEMLEKNTPDLFEEGGKLKEGIYVALDIRLNDGKFYLHNVDENGSILKQDILIYAKSKEDNPSFNRIKTMMLFTPMVSVNKSFNSSYKFFISTCNPFSIGFSKKNYINKIKDNGYESKMADGIKAYFKAAKDYVNDDQIQIFNGFENIVSQYFFKIIAKDIDLNSLKANSEIIIFCKGLTKDIFQTSYTSYLKKKLFNKEIFNVTLDSEVYGIADNLNTFTDSKLFLKHQTATFELNYRITTDEILRISKFYWLLGNNLPNPLPIFVNKDEANLNSDVVKLFNGEEGKVSYSEIISSLLNRRRTNLQNFYLLFIQKGQIIDLDFVPTFKYILKDKENNDFQIEDLFGHETLSYFDSSKDNVFDFQFKVVNFIFNRQLIQQTKAGSLWIKYFDDLEIKPDFGLTDSIYNLLNKYRRSWYDFVYKSMHNEITMTMINEMFIDSIVDDLRHDEEMKKTFQIRKKISLWFGLQPLFDNQFKQNNMANKTQELQTKLRTVAQTESLHIENDDEFAFAAGQIIWKLLIQSESANRTHALLEPFLQKTDPVLFKQAIANTFNQYKYKFTLYSNKYEFDKLFSEVMGYFPNIINMKEHLPMILAGYFSESVFNKEK